MRSNLTETELERRRKISASLTGYKRPPFSMEHRAKLRAANLGKKLSEETKKLLLGFAIGNKVNLGRKHTNEWKEKMKGRIPWNKGKPFTAIRGAKNHRWKGGITSKNMQVRNSFEYKQWRKAVFDRDNYTCVFCQQRGGELNADHIKPFAYFPELRLDITNGRTLCLPCHKTTYKYAKK